MIEQWKIWTRSFFRGVDEPRFWKKDRKVIGIINNAKRNEKPYYQVRLSTSSQDKKGKALSRGKLTFYDAQKFAKEYMKKNK